jgi:hypothetical protein
MIDNSSFSRRSIVKSSLMVGKYPHINSGEFATIAPPEISNRSKRCRMNAPKAPTGRQHTSLGHRPRSHAPIDAKAPTGRQHTSPGHRPGSSIPVESRALKGRNKGGAA